MKQCGACNIVKPYDEFHRCRSRRDGRTSTCKACSKERSSLWVQNNKGRRADKAREYRKKRPDVMSKVELNRPKSHAANKRVARRRAVPQWLTAEQKTRIEAIYQHAADCRAVSGQEYHVDHVVPLKHPSVCGLHVPWNLQVLPADANDSKGNSFEGGWM